MPSSRARPATSRCAGIGVVELGHLTEHGHTPVGRHRRHCVERGAHRRRVGVVGVVEDDAAGVGVRRPASASTTARPDRARRQPRRSRPRRRRRRRGRRPRWAPCARRSPPARTSARPHGVRAVKRARARSSRDSSSIRTSAASSTPNVSTAAAVEPAIAATNGSSALSTAVPVAGSAVDELGLGAGDALDAAQPFGVRGGDRRDDTDVGPADGAQAGDLAEPAHAHLEDQHLGVVRGTEDRHREPLLVVEAALVGGHPPRGADRRRDEVLGARLAHAAGDPDDGRVEPARAHEARSSSAADVSGTITSGRSATVDGS